MTIAVPLPNGRWLVLEQEDFEAALLRGAEMMPAAAATAATVTEPLVTSAELAKLIKVGSTTIEAMAADGRIPSLRCGKALRFLASEVVAALKVRQ